MVSIPKLNISEKFAQLMIFGVFILFLYIIMPMIYIELFGITNEFYNKYQVVFNLSPAIIGSIVAYSLILYDKRKR